jgi:alpha-tubulin suppressor-like RCC1 family protein
MPIIVPDYIAALDNIVDVAGGSKGIVVLCADGTVKAWGWQLDFPSTLENVIAIYANKMCFVALKNDGTLVAWGNIHSGGDNRDIPEGVQGNISYIKSIG